MSSTGAPLTGKIYHNQYITILNIHYTRLSATCNLHQGDKNI